MEIALLHKAPFSSQKPPIEKETGSAALQASSPFLSFFSLFQRLRRFLRRRHAFTGGRVQREVCFILAKRKSKKKKKSPTAFRFPLLKQFSYQLTRQEHIHADLCNHRATFPPQKKEEGEMRESRLPVVSVKCSSFFFFHYQKRLKYLQVCGQSRERKVKKYITS